MFFKQKDISELYLEQYFNLRKLCKDFSLCRRLLAVVFVSNSCAEVRMVMELSFFPQTYLPNIATFPKPFSIEGKAFKPHLGSADCAQDPHVCVLQLRAKGSVWSPSHFWLIHTSQSSWECACRELAASPSLASWLGGHLAHEGRGTELTSAAQLSVRGPGPCWQNHSPCSSDEDGLAQVEHQVFRAKNKLEM